MAAVHVRSQDRADGGDMQEQLQEETQEPMQVQEHMDPEHMQELVHDSLSDVGAARSELVLRNQIAAECDNYGLNYHQSMVLTKKIAKIYIVTMHFASERSMCSTW